MYGTIFTLKVKSGHEEQLTQEIDRGNPKGMIAWFLMKPDNKDGDLIGVAVFESKEAHIANSNSSEQNESFSKVMEHIDAEPTWTDGEFIAGAVT